MDKKKVIYSWLTNPSNMEFWMEYNQKEMYDLFMIHKDQTFINTITIKSFCILLNKFCEISTSMIKTETRSASLREVRYMRINTDLSCSSTSADTRLTQMAEVCHLEKTKHIQNENVVFCFRIACSRDFCESQRRFLHPKLELCLVR